MFTKWLLKPNLERPQQALTAKLLPMMGAEGYVIDFEDPVPANKDQNLEIADRGYRVGLITQNEGRELLGLGAIDGGDEISPYVGLPGIGAGGSMAGKVLVRAISEPQTRDDWETIMLKAWRKRLKREAAAIADALEAQLGGVNEVAFEVGLLIKLDVPGIDYSWDWWARYGEDLIAELTAATSSSLVEYGLETSHAHRLAVEYARERADTLLRIDGNLNLANMARERCATIISEGLAEGQSLGQIARLIRDDFAFSPGRAMSIAQTETATAWGWGSLRAVSAQGPTEKGWFTQGTGDVCPICIENEAAGWIGIGDKFPSGDAHVPAHTRCRCNSITRVPPLANIDVEADAVEPAEIEHRVLDAELRCPECNKLLGWDVVGGHFRCQRCKHEFEVE